MNMEETTGAEDNVVDIYIKQETDPETCEEILQVENTCEIKEEEEVNTDNVKKRTAGETGEWNNGDDGNHKGKKDKDKDEYFNSVCKDCSAWGLMSSMVLLKLKHIPTEEKNTNLCVRCNKSMTAIYHCSVCNKQFDRKTNLRTHESTMHGGRKYKCSECEKTFPSCQSFEFHRRRFHTTTSQQNFFFQCELCFKSWKTAANLRKHRAVCKKKHKT